MKRQEFMRNRSFLFFATIFCAFNLIVVNGGLILFGHDNTQLNSIRDVLLAQPTYSDSWDPMSRGLKIFLAGKDPTIYQQVFFDQKHKFQYPPTSLVIIDGLRKVFGSFDNANVVIDWISWVCLLGTIVFTALIFLEGLQRYVPEEIRGKSWLAVTLIALSALAYYPLHRAFVLGQIQVWLDFLFTLSVWFWLRNRNDGSGVCLGLISIIKPQMGLFLAWGFIRKFWKFCVSIAGVVAFFLTVSLWRYGLAAHIKYLEVLSYIGQRGETYFPNQSINGLINRMLHNGNNLHWDAWEFSPENATVRIVTISTSILLIAFALFFSKTDTKDRFMVNVCHSRIDLYSGFASGMGTSLWHPSADIRVGFPQSLADP